MGKPYERPRINFVTTHDIIRTGATADQLRGIVRREAPDFVHHVDVIFDESVWLALLEARRVAKFDEKYGPFESALPGEDWPQRNIRLMREMGLLGSGKEKKTKCSRCDQPATQYVGGPGGSFKEDVYRCDDHG